MNVINVSQRSPEWRLWRSQGVSASEAAIIMGRSPHKTPWRLWAEKTGLVLEQPLDNNPLIRIGKSALCGLASLDMCVSPM
jgi:predicted phage-related endonuclease